MNLDNLSQYLKDARLPWLVTGLFGVFALWSLVNVMRLMFISPDPAEPQMAVPPLHHAAVNRLNLADLHLFGVYDSNLANLPKTTLQLTLQGTEANTSGIGVMVAVIAGPDGQANVYKVGDSLPGGAIVHKIMPMKVIIEHNGNLEELDLPIPKLNIKEVAA